MDLVAEYAAVFGAPRPEQPWHEVVALASRASRYESRRVLASLAGNALAQPTKDADGRKEMVVASLERNAWPFGVSGGR